MPLSRRCDSTEGGASRTSGRGKAPIGEAWMKLTERLPLEMFQGRPSNDWLVCPLTEAVSAQQQSTTATIQDGKSPATPTQYPQPAQTSSKSQESVSKGARSFRRTRYGVRQQAKRDAALDNIRRAGNVLGKAPSRFACRRTPHFPALRPPPPTGYKSA